MLILFFTIPPASASRVFTKKHIKNQRHDKKSRVTTQNLPDTFLFYENFSLIGEKSRCTCSAWRLGSSHVCALSSSWSPADLP